MQTQNLSGDDIRFLAQQQDYEVDIMVGQMTTLMQNITNLQNDTDDKVKQLESQGWFKRMTNTLFGKNKATKQEIQKNNDKVVTYISQSVSQLYQMNLINERVICSLGNRMNEVYAQVTEMYNEQLNMKAQISEIMAIQQQTLETMGAFVTKLNEKIESIDNFHMLISEVQNGMYYNSSKLYNLCSILSQLDRRQMEDGRKMSLLRDTMEKTGIITYDEVTVFQCLQKIIALPQEKVGLIYLELCNFRNSFPANLFADMIESYHFLSKMEKMSKKKETIIQRVLDKYELDSDAVFSVADIAESFFENKQSSLVSIDNIQIAMDNGGAYSDNEPMTNKKFEKMYDDMQRNPETGDYCNTKEVLENLFTFAKEYAEQGLAAAQYNYGLEYLYGSDELGIEKDEYEAEQWFRKASEQKYAKAQYQLGLCYFYGWGVEEDEWEAAEWFEKASQQGYAAADFELGKCYYYGVGADEDKDYAETLIRSAADNGVEAAQDFLDENF